MNGSHFDGNQNGEGDKLEDLTGDPTDRSFVKKYHTMVGITKS